MYLSYLIQLKHAHHIAQQQAAVAPAARNDSFEYLYQPRQASVTARACRRLELSSASELFSESESGGAKPAGHTSRRQLLAAGIVLTSTRVNAFDRTATAEVSMLGGRIGARLTLATRGAREGQQRNRDCRWLQRTDRAPMGWICSA